MGMYVYGMTYNSSTKLRYWQIMMQLKIKQILGISKGSAYYLQSIFSAVSTSDASD